MAPRRRCEMGKKDKKRKDRKMAKAPTTNDEPESTLPEKSEPPKADDLKTEKDKAGVGPVGKEKKQSVAEPLDIPVNEPYPTGKAKERTWQQIQGFEPIPEDEA